MNDSKEKLLEELRKELLRQGFAVSQMSNEELEKWLEAASIIVKCIDDRMNEC